MTGPTRCSPTMFQVLGTRTGVSCGNPSPKPWTRRAPSPAPLRAAHSLWAAVETIRPSEPPVTRGYDRSSTFHSPTTTTALIISKTKAQKKASDSL